MAADPRFRAILRIGKTGESLHQLAGPGEAKHLAKLVVHSIREACARYPEIECTHLFLSGPLGLSMMIGQLSNTLGMIQTYDHVGPRAAGQYKPALRVTA
jgi:CBASS immunity sensor of nucleotide second messenger signals